MPKPIHVAHHIPGRIRIKIPQIKGDAHTCGMVEEMAASIEGIHRIETNPVTGSVLVHYAKDDPDMLPRLTQALDNLSMLLETAGDEEAGELGGLVGPADLPALLPLLIGAGGLIFLRNKGEFLGNPILLGGLLLASFRSCAFQNRQAKNAASPS